MAEDAIIQDVILQGQEDIKAGFASIERAGVQMFANLQAASELSGLTKFTLSIAAITAALVGVTSATFKWAESAAKATNELGNLADQLGTTIEDVSTLVASFNSSSDSLGNAFQRMAVKIKAEWPQIQKEQRGAANAMIADNLAVQTSYLALERAQVQLSNAGKTLANQQIANSNSIRGAQLSLTEAIENLRKAEGGEDDPAFNQRIAREKAQLAVQQARLALSEAQKKADEDAALSANKLAQAAADKTSAELKLNQDIEKAAEASRNSIDNLTKHVDNLAKGVTDASLKVNASADNVVKGLIASVGPAGEALQGLKGTFASVADAPPILKEVLLKLADVFQNTEDHALKTAIAVQLFGKSIAEQMVQDLSKGSAAILAEQQRLKDLGIEITKTEQLIAKNLTNSLHKLSNDLSIISNKIGLVFAPSFTAIIKSITEAVENNNGEFKKFAEIIEQSATPAIAGFVAALTKGDLKNFKLSPEQIISAKEWQDKFTSIKNIAVGAFSLIGIAATVVSDLMNDIFGKDFISPLEVGITALILKFGGFYGILLLVGTALDKLTDGLVMRGLGGLVDLLGLLGQAIGAIFNRLSGKISTDELKRTLDEIDVKAREVAKKVFDGTKKTGDDLVSNMKKAEDEVVKVVTDMQDRVGVALNKGAVGANNTADNVRGIGDAAKTSLPDLKKLTDEAIKFQGVGERTKTSGIQVISATEAFKRNTDFVPAPGRQSDPVMTQKTPFKVLEDASKSFGNAIKTAQENVDALDQALGKVEDFKPPEFGLKEATDEVDRIIAKFADLEKIEPPKIELPKADDKALNEALKPKIEPEVDFTSTLDKVNEALRPLSDAIVKGVSVPAEVIAAPFRDGAKLGLDAIKTTVDFFSEKLSNFSIDPKGVDKATDDARKLFDEFSKIAELEVSPEFDDKFAESMKQSIEAVKTDLPAAIQDIATEIQSGLSDIDLHELEQKARAAFEEIKTNAAGITEGIDLSTVMQEITQAAQSAFETIKTGASGIQESLVAPFRDAAPEINTNLQSVLSLLEQIKAAASGITLPSAGGFAGAGAGGSAGFAEGGLFRGRGGIDQNLALLSDFEFVINSNATKGWGLSFMRAVNAMDFDSLSRYFLGATKSLRGFNVGGLFESAAQNFSPRMVPAFADGGLNVAPPGDRFSGHMTVDLRTDKGTFKVLAPTNTARELQRMAVSEVLSSAGPPPNWVGRRGR